MRRATKSAKRILDILHYITSVGWVGVGLCQLTLNAVALVTASQPLRHAAHEITHVFDRALLIPLGSGSLITGVLLGLKTKWGVVRYWWVLVKLVLTIAVLIFGGVWMGAWVGEAVAASAHTAGATPAEYVSVRDRLLVGSVKHGDDIGLHHGDLGRQAVGPDVAPQGAAAAAPPTSGAADSMSRSMAPRPVVEIEDLTRVFRRGSTTVAALDGVSVGFAPGSLTAVMGPSGSGKSTLLQCAAGLDRPTSGTVRLRGVDLSTLDETPLTELRRDAVGFVFQQFNLLPALTAAQNVALPLRLAGRRPTASTITDALAAVGVADRAEHRPSELSGGQQQRVAIARALVAEPEVVFADEPTGALDSAPGRQIMTLLRSLVDEHGHTVVLVTHEPVVAAFADRALFLSDGRVAGQLEDPTVDSLSAWSAAR